jgi:hypothetical protein
MKNEQITYSTEVLLYGIIMQHDNDTDESRVKLRCVSQTFGNVRL